jgi:ABC-type Fe3+-hydroxamate transport system substrate-binding protein
MKKILIALAVVSLTACGSRKSEVQKEKTETKTENKTEIVENRDVQTVNDNQTVEIIPTDTTATVSVKDSITPKGAKIRVFKLNKARLIVSDTKTVQVDKTAVKKTKNVKAIKRQNIKHKHTQREAWPYWWLFWLIILILLYLFARFVVLKNYL